MSTTKKLSLILQTFFFNLIADPCYNYQNLSDPDRKVSYATPEYGLLLCDNFLPVGWYRFVGAAGTKMPVTRVPAFRCGTVWSGWLDGAQPKVEDGEVGRRICFSDRSTGCRYSTYIFAKNCGPYFIYKLYPSTVCSTRYCVTD